MKKSRFFTEDKTAYAILLFFFIMLSDAFAVLTGFGGAFVTALMLGSDMMFSTYESLVISSLAICGILLTALYAYRTNQPKKLMAIAAANIIMSLLALVINSLYYPLLDMLLNVIHKVTGAQIYSFDILTCFLSELISVPMLTLCLVLLRKLKNRSGEAWEKLPFRRVSLITVNVFVLVTVAGLGICNIPVSEAYNNWGMPDVAEWAKGVIGSAVRGERDEKLFESITGDTDYSQVREMMKDTEAVSVFPSENGKVKMKKITYGTANISEKPYEAYGIFETLRQGEEKEAVLKRMKKFADITAVCVEYGENAVRETYELSAFYDISFLHLIEMEWFDGTVVFENGIMTEGECTRTLETNAESDEVETFEEKYRIGE